MDFMVRAGRDLQPEHYDQIRLNCLDAKKGRCC